MSGGDESVNTDVNLKSITVTDKGEATEVIMYLLSGSVLTGKEESKLVKLPKYEISFLQSPARMRVRFYNIDYYDYSFDGGEQSSGLVPVSYTHLDVYKRQTYWRDRTDRCNRTNGSYWPDWPHRSDRSDGRNRSDWF